MPDRSKGPATSQDSNEQYVVRVRGHLADRWADWFDGFTLTREPAGVTVLTGRAVDQAALQGVLRQLADLGLPLLSVNSVPAQSDAPTSSADRS